MKIQFRNIVCLILAPLILGACASPTVIDSTRYARPKAVAIVEPPRMRNVATVGSGHNLVNLAAQQLHFSPTFDMYFVVDDASSNLPDSPDYVQRINDKSILDNSMSNQGFRADVLSGATSALMGSLIQASADSTMAKASEFDKNVHTRVPNFDLRRDIVNALSDGFKKRGIAVSLIKDDGKSPSRLRWPAPGIPGKAMVQSGQADPVNADVLIQISPVTRWIAPSPFNNFRRDASIEVVIFDGRTKAYLGSQAFWYTPSAWDREYPRYDALVADIDAASQAMREGVLTLVPQIVNAVAR